MLAAPAEVPDLPRRFEVVLHLHVQPVFDRQLAVQPVVVLGQPGQQFGRRGDAQGLLDLQDDQPGLAGLGAGGVILLIPAGDRQPLLTHLLLGRVL